ncbi:hypothetical protein DdX_18257 [Ditylenchus destructor]|uniref:Uncharacterized protein n=1 Tax=Ditylenchus destructor TaxID=166010 RepID=A0AAD4QSY1_9BILA|nr:hypothetical protein DdX_18257 [Ditylenchus destructor]
MSSTNSTSRFKGAPGTFYPKHLTYINFGENAITMICEFVSMSLIIHLFYITRFKKTRFKRMSPSLEIFLLSEMSMAFLTIFYRVYVVFNWRPPVLRSESNPMLYDMNVLFWTGILNNNFFALASVPAVFLAIDRCLALNFIQHKIRQRISVFGIVLLVLLYLGSSAYYLNDLPLDMEFAFWLQCEVFTCLTIRSASFLQHMVKMASGIITVICGIYFFYVCGKSSHSKNIKNRMVKLVVISELVLNVVPNCMKYFFNKVIGISITWYLGEYGVLLCAVELTVHSVLYTRMFKGNWNPFAKPPTKVQSIRNISRTT